jgi:pimeloyl-ACP methyl ester carboxylesterase
MAADKDVIRDEHTLRIFHAIPKAHLCIFPGATHMIPWEDPALFNQTVEKFFRDPFTRPDTKQMFLTHSAGP